MSERRRIAGKVSSLCEGFLIKRYTRGKLLSDPLYDGVHGELADSELPLLDIGCGMGILAMYLRERGWENPVVGLDYDGRKISDGRAMLSKGSYQGVTLERGDARECLPDHSGVVTILDILQFFDPEEQRELVRRAVARVGPGGKLIIRTGILEKNLRFRVTWLIDIFARAIFWMKAAPVHYPTREFFQEVLEAEGFEVEIRPLWGRTPFNNFVVVAKHFGMAASPI